MATTKKKPAAKRTKKATKPGVKRAKRPVAKKKPPRKAVVTITLADLERLVRAAAPGGRIPYEMEDGSKSRQVSEPEGPPTG